MVRRRRRGGVVAVTVIVVASMVAVGTPTRAAGGPAAKPSCADPRMLCPEVGDQEQLFGRYVGHDEPSVDFYSNTPGSGNHMRYQLTVPTEPGGPFSTSKGYDFELYGTFWFGMVLCDTQSYPEQIQTCTPDSDSNIVDPTQTSRAPGSAALELQFFPPGWIPWFAGSSCDPVKWCAALNIFSAAEDPIHGTVLNPTCQAEAFGGGEYTNAAFITLDGRPLGPPNPLQFDTTTSGNPFNPDIYLFNPGDRMTVTLTDTTAGLSAVLTDTTTGSSGSMTASAANGFGQIKYAPSGHECTLIPYSFHPMYSTSTPQTRVLWSIHNSNVMFAAEIGHFDFCSHINANTASCDGTEGPARDSEPADGDDNFCFPAVESLLYPATGCVDTNAPGFDGVDYQRNYWPDGRPSHPTPALFSSPRSSSGFTSTYPGIAFDTDLPLIEASQSAATCDPLTGAGCLDPPITDDGALAAFYPYYSTVATSAGCAYGFGATLPGTIDDFGGSSAAEYGPAFAIPYWRYGGHGATDQVFFEFYSGSRVNHC